jgi:hypothetical protein
MTTEVLSAEAIQALYDPETMAIHGELEMEHFEAWVGSHLRVKVPDGEDLLLEISHVERTKGQVPNGRKGFSVVLKGPKDRYFIQEHAITVLPDDRILGLFIVCQGPRDDHYSYQLIFN